MKVLNIIQRYPPAIGGAEIYCQTINQYVSFLGVDVKVLTLDIYEENEYCSDLPLDEKKCVFGKVEFDGRVKVIRCKKNRIHSLIYQLLKILDKKLDIYFYAPHSIELYFRLFKEIKETDIVHLHTFPYPHNTIAFFIAKVLSKKIVFSPHFHPSHPIFEKKFNFWLLKKCDAIFAVSEFEKQYLVKKKISEQKIFIIYNSINPDKYNINDLSGFKNEKGNWFNLNDETKVVLFIGRKVNYKGIETLVDALELVKKEIKSVKLFLIGPDFPWFKKFYNQLSFDKKEYVIDLGIVPHKEKVNWLHIADLLVLPSGFEAFGIVFLEAWICGTPVIGSDRGAMPDVIDDGGFVFRYGDIYDLKDKIIKILNNSALANRLGDNGKSNVMKKYLSKNIGQKILNIYQEVI